MSEQPPQPPASDPSAGGSDLEGYLRANRATVTEDALRRAALSAGHSPEAVDAALTATRDVAAPASGGSVVRRIFLSYLAVYLILDVLMLVNPANKQSGFLGDASGIGIVILSVALGGGFLASLIWIASRQAFWLLVGVGIALAGLSALANSPIAAIVGVGIGGALALASLTYGRGRSAPSAASAELLVSMPLLILLVIGGACVATGLPIPRTV
jgi:hypothetical protein